MSHHPKRFTLTLGGGFPDGFVALLFGSAHTLALGWVVSRVTQRIRRATWESAHRNGISYALFRYLPDGCFRWSLLAGRPYRKPYSVDFGNLGFCHFRDFEITRNKVLRI